MGKRKSCDLCTLKKIKCDGLAPRCSRCVDYSAQCSWTPGIHRRVRGPSAHSSSKPSGITRTAPSPSSAPLLLLETRLSELEAEVKKLRAAAAADAAATAGGRVADPLLLEAPAEAPTGPLTPSSPSSPIASLSTDYPLVLSDVSHAQYSGSTASSGGGAMSQTKTMRLPLRKDIRPIVDDYFASVNCCYPIFDPIDFKNMLEANLTENDINTICRDEATWAAISIVLALGLQSRTHPQWSPCEQPIKNEHSPERIHLRNAQSKLEVLLSRTEDLMGIQVLLGLSLYVYRSDNPTPAQFLIASAVKMAYRLGLHLSTKTMGLEKHVCIARKRLFWIVYILDRDMSMTIGDPYMLQDHDITVDMPSNLPYNQAVTSSTTEPNGSTHNDAAAFLRCRVGLAQIQGKVYDYIYSARAQAYTPEESGASLQIIWTMLDQWSSALPQDFYRDHPSDLHANPPITENFVLLYFTYFRVICRAQRVHSHNTEWIRGLIAYSTRWSVEFDPSADPAPCPLPAVREKWTETVRAARLCMILFQRGRQTVAVRVLEEVACAYVAALVILIADKLTIMEHHNSSRSSTHLQKKTKQLLAVESGMGGDGDDGDAYGGARDEDENNDGLIALGIQRLSYLPETSISRKYDLYNSVARACRELNIRADAARTAFDFIVQHFAPSAVEWNTIV